MGNADGSLLERRTEANLRFLQRPTLGDLGQRGPQTLPLPEENDKADRHGERGEDENTGCEGKMLDSRQRFILVDLRDQGPGRAGHRQRGGQDFDASVIGPSMSCL